MCHNINNYKYSIDYFRNTRNFTTHIISDLLYVRLTYDEMISIIELFYEDGNIIVDASKYTEDQLYLILKGDFSMKTEKAQILLHRSFDLEDLLDINSGIAETYYIKYSKGEKEYTFSQINELFSFSRDDLKVINTYGDTTSYTVIFGKEISIHIVETLYEDDCLNLIEERLKDLNLPSLSDEQLYQLFDKLRERNIQVKNISLDNISPLLLGLDN